MQHEGVIAFCIGKLRAGFEAVADPIGETAEELGGECEWPERIDAGGAEGGLDCREGVECFEAAEGSLCGLAMVPEFQISLSGEVGC